MWRDSVGFLDLGGNIASTHGLTKYLIDVAPMRKKARFQPTTLPRNVGVGEKPK